LNAADKRWALTFGGDHYAESKLIANTLSGTIVKASQSRVIG
jgi:hypothetical protein